MSTNRRVVVGDHRLEYEWQGPDVGGRPEPTLVFLHEGLGSVSAWRDFPTRVAAATGLRALVYSRRGYGRSDPLAGPWPVSFMHDEARELGSVLEALGVRDPLLVGHSDGGSIALIYASEHPVRALVLEAPHVFVEDVTVWSIAALARRTDHERFERHHGTNALPLVKAWTSAWLDPAFRAWNIEGVLPAIRCPVLLIQGREDEYGSLAQVNAISRAIPAAKTVLLGDCGHSPHRDRPDAVLEAMVDFCGKL